ncbi:MAG: YbjQ family protein [Candidatus Saelkia tenebricola]|nr:YbjQ family protein [Candidatus Saelkia tenebricola]
MDALIYFILFIFVGYISGTIIEKKHYLDIEVREKKYLNLPAISSKNIEDESRILSANLVSGSVVISLDYFKRFLAGLRNVVGGRIHSYETLLDRSRREAVLRMKENASSMNADMILNIRFQTLGVGQKANKKGNIGCFEVVAYGTAVKLKPGT